MNKYKSIKVNGTEMKTDCLGLLVYKTWYTNLFTSCQDSQRELHYWTPGIQSEVEQRWPTLGLQKITTIQLLNAERTGDECGKISKGGGWGWEKVVSPPLPTEFGKMYLQTRRIGRTDPISDPPPP